MKISTTNPARIGLVNIGAPAAGINAAIRAVVRKTIHMGSTPVVIKDGIGKSGLRGIAIDWVSQLCQHTQIQLNSDEAAQLLNKPNVNEVYLTGQNLT